MSGRFEDLYVWKLALDLAGEVCRDMRTCRVFALVDQMMRSAISIPSNIAEGSRRGSRKDFLLFLTYAKGSTAELKTQLLLAEKIGVLSASRTQELARKADSVGYLIHTLSESLKPSPSQTLKPSNSHA